MARAETKSSQERPMGRPRGRPRSVFTDQDAGTVKALERGLLVLKTLSREGRMSLAELAQRMDVPVSTAHRLLYTLQKHGFCTFDDDTQNWSVGLEAYRIGSAYLSGTNLIDIARPVMRRLMEATGETANLGIADEGDVVFIAQVEAHNPIRAFFRSGTRGAIHASGIGKALLAQMDDKEVARIINRKGLEPFTPKTLSSSNALLSDLEATRARGWSYDDEERYLGMRCVAASIFDAYGEPIAGISISGPTVRLKDEEIAGLGDEVAAAAQEVTRLIGGTPRRRGA